MNDQQSLGARIITINSILNALKNGRSPLLSAYLFKATLVAITLSFVVALVIPYVNFKGFIDDQFIAFVAFCVGIFLPGYVGYILTMRYFWRTHENLGLEDYVYTVLSAYEPINKGTYSQLQALAKTAPFQEMQSSIIDWAINEKVSIDELVKENNYLKSGRYSPKNKFVTREIKS